MWKTKLRKSLNTMRWMTAVSMMTRKLKTICPHCLLLRIIILNKNQSENLKVSLFRWMLILCTLIESKWGSSDLVGPILIALFQTWALILILRNIPKALTNQDSCITTCILLLLRQHRIHKIRCIPIAKALPCSTKTST